MSKTLKTESSEWASSELKTSRSEDQVSKALKTEVLMNVSRFQNLKLRRSSANGTLTLKTLNNNIILPEVNRKVHCADRLVQQSCKELAKCHCQAAKSTVPLGTRQKYLLSYNGHYISQRSSIQVPL